MKRILNRIFCALLFVVMLTPAASAQDNDGVLRILAIGNSFSDDATTYLPDLLENLGVENVELARLYVGGCSLQRHMEFYNNEQAAYQFYHSKAGENKWIKSENNVTMQYALQMGQWDIITMQQASGDSGIYDSYVPYLEQLIAVVKEAQPNAQLAWHMTWSYSNDSNHQHYPRYGNNQIQMYGAIYDCVQKLKADAKEIDIIIPSGSMIQSLRASAVNNAPTDLTRDGYHMGHGVGRYALACLWYETLIKPFTNRSMKGNTLRISKGLVAVTDITAAYCQIAAAEAVRKPLQIFPIKGAEKLASKFSGERDIVK